jgi:hypothetical protein
MSAPLGNKYAEANSKFKDEYVELAYKYCLLGADDAQLAVFFDVCEKTINNWKEEHPKFLQSLKNGKDIADAEIAQSLYHRAKGYSHPEDKIFNNGGEEMVVETTKHYPPDTTAGIFWLKNRQKKNWRDEQRVINEDATTESATKDSLMARAAAVTAELKRREE